MSNDSDAVCDTGEKTNQANADVKTLTRQQLFEYVWTTPMRTLAKDFGISDVGLAKVCRRYDIPRPPVGYWAKLEHGKKVPKPSLRANEKLDRSTITFDLRTNKGLDETSHDVVPTPRSGCCSCN